MGNITDDDDPAGAEGRPPPPTAQDWERHREMIEELYSNRDLKLSDVRKHMQDRHGFNATERMYKTRFSNWGLRKYTKSSAMEALILSARDQGSEDPKFEIDGKTVPISKVQRYVRRSGRTMQDLGLDDPSSAAASRTSSKTLSDVATSTPTFSIVDDTFIHARFQEPQQKEAIQPEKVPQNLTRPNPDSGLPGEQALGRTSSIEIPRAASPDSMISARMSAHSISDTPVDPNTSPIQPYPQGLDRIGEVLSPVRPHSQPFDQNEPRTDNYIQWSNTTPPSCPPTPELKPRRLGSHMKVDVLKQALLLAMLMSTPVQHPRLNGLLTFEIGSPDDVIGFDTNILTIIVDLLGWLQLDEKTLYLGIIYLFAFNASQTFQNGENPWLQLVLSLKFAQTYTEDQPYEQRVWADAMRGLGGSSQGQTYIEIQVLKDSSISLHFKSVLDWEIRAAKLDSISSRLLVWFDQGKFTSSSSVQTFQYQYDAQTRAMQILQEEHDRLVSDLARSQTRFRRTAQINEDEIRLLTDDNVKLRMQVEALRTHVERLASVQDAVTATNGDNTRALVDHAMGLARV